MSRSMFRVCVGMFESTYLPRFGVRRRGLDAVAADMISGKGLRRSFNGI